MTTQAPSLDLGELELKGENLEFFGVVYVFYFSATLEWFPKEFHGILTQDGFKYRGRWTEGPDFEALSKLLMDDPRLVETATECVKRRVHYA